MTIREPVALERETHLDEAGRMIPALFKPRPHLEDAGPTTYDYLLLSSFQYHSSLTHIFPTHDNHLLVQQCRFIML